MASHLIFLSLLLTTTAAISPSPSSSPSPSPSQPSFSLLPIPPSQPSDVQFNTLIDALMSTGDFKNWANLLAAVDPAIIPISATFFVPDDDAFLAGLTTEPPAVPLNFLDPLLFPYHIVPHRLPFASLRLLPAGARLPTLLPGFSLLINNHSAANFTVSGARITRPDIFLNGGVSVHGIGAVLDYALFGRNAPPPEKSKVPEFNVEDVAGNGDEKKSPGFRVSKSGASGSFNAGFGVASVVVGLVALFWVLRNRG